MALEWVKNEDTGLVVKKKILKMFNSAEQSYRLERERYFVFNAGKEESFFRKYFKSKPV